MQVYFEKKSDKLIISLIGELDHHSAEEARVKIDDEIDKENIKKVILDFEGVTFMDSSGIGAVVGRYKKVNSKGGSFCVTGIKNGVYKVFEISGLFKIIKSYDSIREALKCI